MNQLKPRWRKVDKHLHCLHISNGQTEVAFYASWSEHAMQWLLSHKNLGVGSDKSSPTLGAIAKRRLERVALAHMERWPNNWNTPPQSDAGGVVWCAAPGSLHDIKLQTLGMYARGLELIHIHPGTSATSWLVCRMR